MTCPLCHQNFVLQWFRTLEQDREMFLGYVMKYVAMCSCGFRIGTGGEKEHCSDTFNTDARETLKKYEFQVGEFLHVQRIKDWLWGRDLKYIKVFYWHYNNGKKDYHLSWHGYGADRSEWGIPGPDLKHPTCTDTTESIFA